MNEYIAEITLDLDCRKVPPRIAAGQYDKDRKCLIHITANDASYSAAGATAVIKGRRQDKSYFSENCTIDNSGNVVYTMSEATLAVSGFTYAKIVLSDSTKTYSTQLFIIDVDSGLEGNVTEIDSFSVFNDCLRLLAEILGVADATARLDQYITVDDVLNSLTQANSDNVFSADFTANRFIHKYAISGSALPETTVSKASLGRLPLRYTVAVNDDGRWFVPVSYTNGSDSYTDILWKEIFTEVDSIPTKTSDLTNDSSFMSQEQTDTAIANAIRGISTVRFQVVSSLPPIQGAQSNIIYLIPNEDDDTDNLYDEWIAINNAWELLGSTKIDISGKADKATTLAGYGITDAYTKAQVDEAIPESVNDLNDGNLYVRKYEGSSEPPSSPVTNQYPVPCLWYYEGDVWFLYDKETISGSGVPRYQYYFDKLIPVVPSKTSDLTNDSGFLTAQDISGKMDLAPIRATIDDDTQIKQGQFLVVNDEVWLKHKAYGAAGHKTLAEKSTTLAGYGITDAYTKTQVDGMIPTVPSNVSAFTNDAGYLTQHQDISGKADKATTLTGYGITDAYTKTQVNGMIPTVPSNVSAFTNDAGYLTAHQDISGKEDNSNKVTSLSAQSTDTQYPSAKCVYDAIENMIAGEVVPSYVKEESESVLSKALSHTATGQTIRFIAVSDSHNDSGSVSHDYTRVSNLHCGQAVKYIADRIPLDFVAYLGDSTWAGVAHTSDQYKTDWLKSDIMEMNRFLADGFREVPNIRVVGNHDQCATIDDGGNITRLLNNGAYSLIGRYNAGVSDAVGNYGYYDIENAKLRIIYLNTSDVVSSHTAGTILSVTSEQLNWLCETLIALNTKTDASRWKILIFSHAPLDMPMSGVNVAGDILLQYVNGGTYGSYTFTNHSAKILGNVHGHVHCYSYGYMADKIRRFTIPNSNFYDNNHYSGNPSYASWSEPTTYPKTQNSRTDTSFSLVTIDLDSEMCYVDNYGAGYDREFSLDYKSEPAPVNLFDKADADVVINGRFNSSHGVTADQTNQLVTGFIPATTADTLHVETDLANNKNAYTGQMQFYNSNKEYIGRYRSPKESQNAGIDTTPAWAADYLSADFDLSKAANGGTSSGTAYVRFCLAYTDIDSIVITKG